MKAHISNFAHRSYNSKRTAACCEKPLLICRGITNLGVTVKNDGLECDACVEFISGEGSYEVTYHLVILDSDTINNMKIFRNGKRIAMDASDPVFCALRNTFIYEISREIEEYKNDQ